MTGHKVRPGLGAGAVDETGFSESTALSASRGAESNVVSVIKVTDHNSFLRRNKSEKTLRILDGWFWNFHHWLNTTGVLI